MRLEDAGRLDRSAFVAAFGEIFEDSPWVAETAWARRPWASLSELHAAMVAAVDAAPAEQRLALLRAHPDLAGRAALAGALAPASAAEQAAAGLDRLDPVRYAQLHALNATYRDRFGFPFVACVREHTVDSILADAAARVSAVPEEEERRALGEVARIARLRLEDLVADGVAAAR